MLRPSTLEEREKFYSDYDTKKGSEWFKSNKLTKPQILAVDLGSETDIIKDKSMKGSILNIRNKDLKNKLLKYLPEDVYYDRNTYKDSESVIKSLEFDKQWDNGNILGQELVFDIDPENLQCGCKGTYLLPCDKCMQLTVQKAKELADFLSANYSQLGFVFSGRGMHVHLFDKDAFSLNLKEREELAESAKPFGIDPWVSRGHIRLVRLPYSLNALVSRIVLPIKRNEIESFDPIKNKKIIPNFLL